MFDLISTSSSTTNSGTTVLITFERFARFGAMMGMKEGELMQMLHDFDVTLFDMIGIREEKREGKGGECVR